MDKRKQKTEGAAKGNIKLQRANSKKICKDSESKKEKSRNSKPGRKQQPKAIEINDSDLVKITVEHFFKNKINDLMDKIPDPRVQDMCTYSLNHLSWLGILMFLFGIKSRNQLSKDKETDRFLANLLSLCGSDEENVADPDTMNYLFELIPHEEFESLKTNLVKELMKNRVLDSERLFGSFRIAIDATDLFTFKTPHCDNCLVTKHNDNSTTYSHKILEAKLISERGFAFSVCSESIENVDGEYDKQDCELKAFYRMEKRLHELFPRTQICVLLDGLYACEEVFRICESHNWEYIIVLKPKKIPTLYENALEKREKHSKNYILLEDGEDKEEITWCHNILYRGMKLHIIFSKKITIENGIEVTTLNSWVTNIRPRESNAEKLVKKGGRQRWKIENQGFKEQKHDNYELEHLYGKNPNAWKIYYQLLQIAHMITQLIRYSDLFKKLQEHSKASKKGVIIDSFKKYYNTISNFIQKLKENFRTKIFSELTNTLKGKIQIRFSSA